MRVLLLFQSGFLLILLLVWFLCLKLLKLCYVEVCSFYACFLEAFIINGCLILSKTFFCIYLDDHMVFIFQFVNVVCHISWLVWMVKNPCIPVIKPTWPWCMIFWIFCWNLFLEFCWGFLHLCSSVILACSFLSFFLSFWHLCLVLVLGWYWPHRMSLIVYLPLQFSGRIWVG